MDNIYNIYITHIFRTPARCISYTSPSSCVIKTCGDLLPIIPVHLVHLDHSGLPPRWPLHVLVVLQEGTDVAHIIGFHQPKHGVLWYGGVPKMGRSQNEGFIRENPIKIDDLEVPLFQETSIWCHHQCKFCVKAGLRLGQRTGSC